MSASRFVGRVGGLAVMLGVGAAVSLGQGVAWADDTSQTGGPSVSSTSGPSPTAPSQSRRSAAKDGSARSAQSRITAHVNPGASRVAKPAKLRAAEVQSPSRPVNPNASSAPAATTTGARVESTAAVTPVNDALPKAAAATTQVPITLKTIVTDVLTWIGLGKLAPALPVPALPMPPMIESLWLAVRDVLGRSENIYLLGSKFSLAGYETGQLLTADGTRAVITTDATNLDVEGGFATKTAVVNTVTGKQVGNTLTLGGIPTGATLLNADGTRAVITARSSSGAATVMVIDTATGNQIGNTFNLPGQTVTPTVLTADGSRAVVTTTSNDSITGGTRIAVIDTETGNQIGATVKIPGSNSYVSNADGAHTVVATIDGDWNAGFTTAVTVIDTATGDQIGSPLTLNGRLNDYAISGGLSAVDGHVIVVTDDDSTPGGTTLVTVIDTATSTQVGSLELNGSSRSAPMLSVDGGQALITASSSNPTTQTQVGVIDTETGEQVGTTLNFGSSLSSTNRSADGNHVLITTAADADQVALIDIATGTQAATATVPGGSSNTLLSADGRHALITNSGGAAVIIDTNTGAQTALTSALSASPDAFDINANGTRALITNTVPGYLDGMGTTHVVVIDTATGVQVGTGLTFTGDAGGSVLSADGTHALVTTAVYNPLLGTYSARVAVIDTTTGEQVGSTRTMAGGIVGANLLSDGNHVLLTMNKGAKTQLAVIDTATGKTVSNTVSLAGEYGGEPLFNADRTRVLVPTYHRGPVGTTTIQVLALGSL